MAFISWTIIIVAALTGAPKAFLRDHWGQLFTWWWITGSAWAVWAVVIGIAAGIRNRQFFEEAGVSSEDGRDAPSLGLE